MTPHNPHNSRANGTLALLFAGAVLSVAEPGSAAAGAVVSGRLRSTAAAPKASGSFAENVTVARIAGRRLLRGGLAVEARQLAPQTTYKVTASGLQIGTLTTNKFGRGRARFLPKARGSAQALSIDPRGRQLTVTDANGDDMLEGEIDDPATPGGIRCCKATADEQGCDSLLPDDCTAAGGTNLGAGSCDPDPCPGQSDEDGGPDGEQDDDAGETGEHAD